MSHTLELASIAHGTVDGYRSGCRGSRNSCGAAVSCAEVHIRYQGDWGFRKRIDAGEEAAVIIAAELAEADEVRSRDRAAARDAKRAANEQQRRGRVRQRKPVERKPRPTPQAVVIRDDVARLRALDMTDVAIATELQVSAHLVGIVRRELGLERVTKPVVVLAPSERSIRAAKVRELHAEGKTDRQIAAALDIAPAAANQLRRRLGLPLNPEPRAHRPRVVTVRHDHDPEIIRLHGEGKTDAEIGEALGLSKSRVGELRRVLNLHAHRKTRSRWEGVELAGHGTNASYARGCRCEPCTEAKREYHREYTKQRRADGAGQFHGTAYGYQLGCRARSACPGETSCTDAMLTQERERRRAAGIPAKELVDAGPVRAHVQDLRAAGMTVDQVAEVAGVPRATVKSLLFSRGVDRPPVESLLAERAVQVLAVPIPQEKAA